MITFFTNYVLSTAAVRSQNAVRR